MKKACLVPAIVAFLLLSLSTGRLHADNTYLQPQRIFDGDVTDLVLEHDNKIPSLYALDTSVLEADFRVLDMQSRIMRIQEQDEIFHRMQWRIRLQPRRPGSLRVPPIKIGEGFSEALTLEVEMPAADSAAAKRVFVEVDSDPARPYAGQQVRLKIRLFHDTPLSDGKVIAPDAESAQFYRDRRERNFSETRDGVAYSVREILVVMVPDSAGKLSLTPAAYEGELSGGAKRRIYRQGGPLEFDILPRPATDDNAHWLPASAIELARDWETMPTELGVGAALNFSLNISASGIAASALPENLLALDREDLKIYADRARRSTEVIDGQLLGKLEQRFIAILPRAGSIELPGLALGWWDVETNLPRQARLQGRVVEVDAMIAAGRPADTARPAIGEGLLIDTSILAVLPVVAFGLLLIWVLVRSRIPQTIALSMRKLAQYYWTRRELKYACMAGDAVAARVLLLRWAGLRWPQNRPYGLRQLSKLLNDAELDQELRRLDAALYSSRRFDWDGRVLWRRLRGLGFGKKSRAGSKAAPHSLKAFYPA